MATTLLRELALPGTSMATKRPCCVADTVFITSGCQIKTSCRTRWPHRSQCNHFQVTQTRRRCNSPILWEAYRHRQQWRLLLSHKEATSLASDESAVLDR